MDNFDLDWLKTITLEWFSYTLEQKASFVKNFNLFQELCIDCMLMHQNQVKQFSVNEGESSSYSRAADKFKDIYLKCKDFMSENKVSDYSSQDEFYRKISNFFDESILPIIQDINNLYPEVVRFLRDNNVEESIGVKFNKQKVNQES